MFVNRLATYSSMIALMGSLSCASAFAQENVQATSEQAAQSNAAEEEPEVIVVTSTGTSIRGAAPVGSSLIEVGRDDIDRSATINTMNLLRETPQIFSLGVNDTSRSGNGGAGNIVYGNAINIRGIGPYATLTLINGRRAVPQGTLGATVDPSSIPTIGLKRIEVIADGASAVYGSDAVAGVANLILRRGFEGVQVEGQYGVGSDYDEHQLSLITGKAWNTGQVTVSAQRSYRSNIFGGDRDYYLADLTGMGGADYRVSSCNPGNIYLNGNSYAIPQGGATADNLVEGTQNLCDNMSATTDLMPEQTIHSAVMTLNQDLSDRVTMFVDALVYQRDGQRYSEPYDARISVPETNAFFVSPVGVTLEPCSGSLGLPAGTGCESIDYSFAEAYGSPAVTTFDTQTWQLTAGLDITLPADWLLNVHATMGQNDDQAFNRGGNVNSGALRTALASSDPSTAFNPFGTSDNNQAVIDSIFNYAIDTVAQTKVKDFGMKVDGPLMSLPGGDVKLAAGLGYYEMELWTGQVRGADGERPYNFDPRNRDITSGFAELYIPIVGDGNAMPGIYSLVLDIAGRIDDYSDVGRTENPKIGIDWQPVEDVAIHASYGESFRAPLLTQLTSAGGSNLYIQNYFDPTINQTIRGATLSGGNDELVPETAQTWSVGVDYTPSSYKGARFSVNLFDVTYEGQIGGQLSNLNILRQEDVFSSIILRGAAAQARTAELLAGGINVRSGSVAEAENTMVFVDGRNNNLGSTEARGLDFSMSVPMETDSGDFKFGLLGTWFDYYRVAQTATAESIDQVNNLDYPVSLRMRGSINWQRDYWDLTLFANYTNSYNNTLTGEEISSLTTLDFAASYIFSGGLSGIGEDLKVGLFINNITDEDPPYADIAPSNNGGGGFDPQVGSPVGRLISLSLSKSF
ncbi:TonB-dependent receptor [Alteromonas sp. 1_MG-2023]|uniref:TonB-dependent receptor plug domain-containing protein n=1 Tax=Alteromonas sp. 1_MG-2023 TaxID=3062669 RepID=UPI0026E3EDA7|nr:TonB-dependent receptor [Alteromonas sp. 1_MG-2023]MDO6474537.1 TonB-dependent receptor [Alteromonas sp. 1_MG-2023]